MGLTVAAICLLAIYFKVILSLKVLTKTLFGYEVTVFDFLL